ncbi:putative leader peptide [Pseudonocardia sp. Ae717_Ps2]|uniref:putative leader peptide n=1 Tax=Pseudonocardia sp. Ae717_Ps2 TaxID=1885573 RepID=UPI000AEFF33B
MGSRRRHIDLLRVAGACCPGWVRPRSRPAHRCPPGGPHVPAPTAVRPRPLTGARRRGRR